MFLLINNLPSAANELALNIGSFRGGNHVNTEWFWYLKRQNLEMNLDQVEVKVEQDQLDETLLV